jgi:hypothetical protein
LEPVTKVEAGFAFVAGAAGAVAGGEDAVVPADVGAAAVELGALEPEAVEPEAVEPEAVEPEAVEPEAVEPAAVEPEAVELAAVEPAAVEPAAVDLGAVELGAVELGAVLAVDDVVLAELSEPQPPRAARKETHTNPAHALSAPNLKIIVACPVAA